MVEKKVKLKATKNCHHFLAQNEKESSIMPY